MIPILSSQDVLTLKQQVTFLKMGFLTNFFIDIQKIDLLISKKILSYKNVNNTVFFFKTSENFINLYYFTTNIESLKKDLQILLIENQEVTYIVDIIEKKNNISPIREVFLNSSFRQYTSLIRMSRIITDSEIYSKKNLNIEFANPKKAIEIYDLLQIYFDTFAEQLPFIEEIEFFITKNNIILYLEDDKIIGFLIYELIGLTSYLRYWFVHPDHRDKKIGSSLLNTFFELSKDTKRQLFWVIESNENAIKRYEHFGFVKEDLLDCVMINKDKTYET
jgi:ribosomal protein S18 acetylase RimI-like enzyme